MLPDACLFCWNVANPSGCKCQVTTSKCKYEEWRPSSSFVSAGFYFSLLGAGTSSVTVTHCTAPCHMSHYNCCKCRVTTSKCKYEEWRLSYSQCAVWTAWCDKSGIVSTSTDLDSEVLLRVCQPTPSVYITTFCSLCK